MSSLHALAASTIAAMTLADRIRTARRAAGLSQAQLGKAVGISRAAISLWESGDTKNLKGANLLKAARALGVSPDWLETGKGEMAPALQEVPVPALSQIPIVGTTQAGPDAHWEELGFPVGYGDEYVDMPRHGPNTYALRVRGGSMGQRIRDGEAVVVTPERKPMASDEVVVKTKDGQVMVKELAYWRAGDLALDSIGDAYPRIVLHENDIEFIHVVIGIVPVSSIKHR